jgi:tetratricopeptide (TPR) repeat protein
MMEGKRQEASRAYADLRARFPDSELAPRALFEMGKLKADSGDYEKAIELWVEALKTHPEPKLLQDYIARARKRLTSTTPEGIGRMAAFAAPANPAAPPAHAPRNSVEAVGGTADEAAKDHGD